MNKVEQYHKIRSAIIEAEHEVETIQNLLSNQEWRTGRVTQENLMGWVSPMLAAIHYLLDEERFDRETAILLAAPDAGFPGEMDHEDEFVWQMQRRSHGEG